MCNTMEDQKKTNVPVPLGHTELRNLRNDTNACVEVKTCAHHITLHPFHLSNIGESIKEILNAGIAKYHNEFDGILLGYENVKIYGIEAPMFDDMCYMHQKIEADFYIFKPVLGCTLNGIINKKSNDHVGCLVHQLFNISLPKPAGAQDWFGSKAQIGKEVRFRVNFMQLDARLPYIRGELITIISEDSGISTSDETAAPKKNKVKKFTDDDVDDTQAENETGRKKRLKKKKKTGDLEESELVQPDDEAETSPKKKKTKKEKKVKHAENTEELIEELQDQTEHKKKKKSKSQDEQHLETETNEGKTKKKEKKTKKKKDKVTTEEKERDLLDQTLPDINLEALFANASQSMQVEPEKEAQFNLDFTLPPDPDMEEILKDVSVETQKKKKEKKSSRKRKHDDNVTGVVENTEGTESKKKKKRKST